MKFFIQKNFYRFCIVLILVFSYKAFADSRTDYLIELLLTSGNYRVKVQSAKTLGQIGTSSSEEERKKIVQALIQACNDKNELVRMTAAASLGAIGDPSALTALEKLKSDKVNEVAQQAKDSIKKIESIQKSIATGGPLQGKTTEETQPGGETGSFKMGEVKDTFYIGLGSWSDRSGFEKYETKNYVKNLLITLLGSVPGVKIRPEEEPKKETEKKVKKLKLTPYTLTGSISKVDINEKNQALAEISIIVLDGEGNVSMMLKGKGSASLEGSRKSSKENEKELIFSALGTAVKGAVEPFSNHLQSSLQSESAKNTKEKKGKKKKKSN